MLNWQLHWVSGWDPEHRQYRAVMADNYGHADVYRGRVEGDRLVFESLRDTWAPAAPHLGCLGPGRHHLAERDGRSRTGHGSSSRNTPWCRGHLTIRTGRSARRITLCAVLPRTRPARSPRPRRRDWPRTGLGPERQVGQGEQLASTTGRRSRS